MCRKKPDFIQLDFDPLTANTSSQCDYQIRSNTEEPVYHKDIHSIDETAADSDLVQS